MIFIMSILNSFLLLHIRGHPNSVAGSHNCSVLKMQNMLQ